MVAQSDSVLGKGARYTETECRTPAIRVTSVFSTTRFPVVQLKKVTVCSCETHFEISNDNLDSHDKRLFKTKKRQGRKSQHVAVESEWIVPVRKVLKKEIHVHVGGVSLTYKK